MFTDQLQQPGRLYYDSSVYHVSIDIHVRRFHQALDLFNHAVSKGRTRYLFHAILNQPRKLLQLSDLNLKLVNASEIGSHLVLIDHICGTQGRIKDFDVRFYPLSERLRDRWVSIATARFEGIGLPAVDLIQIKEKYFVCDGHHRISVAKALGQEEIDARITLWRTSA